MIAAVDVYYRHETAVAAAVLFDEVSSEREIVHFRQTVEPVRPYRPGFFFERELPCLLKVLNLVRAPLSAIVVDGHVWLDADKRPGLGAHLYAALGGTIAVIGVAKHTFRQGSGAVPVYRGRSRRPLYVTAAGMDPRTAAEHIQEMHGPHRIPTLLRRVDRLSRGIE